MFFPLQSDCRSIGCDYQAGSGAIFNAQENAYYNVLLEQERNLRDQQDRQYRNYGSQGNSSSYHSQVGSRPDNQLFQRFGDMTLNNPSGTMSKPDHLWQQKRRWLPLKPSFLLLSCYTSLVRKDAKKLGQLIVASTLRSHYPYSLYIHFTGLLCLKIVILFLLGLVFWIHRKIFFFIVIGEPDHEVRARCHVKGIALWILINLWLFTWFNSLLIWTMQSKKTNFKERKSLGVGKIIGCGQQKFEVCRVQCHLIIS